MIGAIGTIGNVGLRSGRLLLYPSYVQDYLDRVRAADGQAVETAVSNVFSQCLQSLVAANLLGVSNNKLAQAASAIKASCFLCGARTLTGCLTPLAQDMPTPTNSNFVTADYNRITGIGDTGNVLKHIGTNYSNAADPQNDKHLAVVKNGNSTQPGVLIGTVSNANGASWIFEGTAAPDTYRINGGPSISIAANAYPDSGFIGISRSSASQSTRRYSAVNATDAANSSPPINEEILLFRGAGSQYANTKIALYSVGRSLDLSVLKSICDTFSTSLAAAIP